MPAQPGSPFISLTQRKAFNAGQSFLIVDGGDLRPVTDLEWAPLINPNLPTAICRSCGRILPVSCFHLRGGSIAKSHAPDCVICVFKAAELYKAEHCFECRAEAVLRHHMRIERDQGLHACTLLEDYIRLIGVSIEWLARKMRVAWETNDSCAHCETAGLPSRWQEIVPNPQLDLSRMTVDRTDRSRLLARDNMTLMCLPGNIAKGKTDAATYNDRQAYWRLFNHSIGDDAAAAPG